MAFEKLGLLGYPLLFCSLLSVTFIVERLAFYMRLRLPSEDGREVPTPLQEVFNAFNRRNYTDTQMRDQVVSLALRKYRLRVFAHLKWLTLLATIAPMFGLLGTVLGMISAFQKLALHTGPVYPALIAGGIWEALLTTAVGLAIALPCVIASQGFRMWGEAHLERLELLLNALAYDGEAVAHASNDESLSEGVTI